MLEKMHFKNTITDKIYEGYSSANTPEATPFFKKSEMQKIIQDTNKTNSEYKCDIRFEYDKEKDMIICDDKEFKQETNCYPSHNMQTIYGMTKVYYFGDEIIFEKTNR